MDKKLQELIDRSDIWHVMQRYSRALDRVDRDMALSCYWEDAIEDHGRFVGNPRDFVEYAVAGTLSSLECHHQLMNHYCELDGDDAHSETYFMFIGVKAQPPHLMTMGRYINHFQRRNGEWRIANRIMMGEAVFGLQPMPNHAAGIPSAYPPEKEHVSRRDRGDVSYQRPVQPRAPRPWPPR